MSEKVGLTIIGAGVIGCAIAYQLSRRYDDVVVIEKNESVKAENQSSRNSGVIHAGVYYPQDISPLKARLCVKGNSLLYEFCERYDVPFLKSGKIILATEKRELPYLHDTVAIAKANGVPGVKLLSRDEVRAMEPHVECVQAGYFPTSGVVEPTSLVYQLYSLASQQGVFFMLGNEVIRVVPGDNGFEITMSANGQQEVFVTERLINAAGMMSDEIALMIQPEFPYEISPYRGEMMQFVRNKRPGMEHAGMNVYPVPMPLNMNGQREAIPFNEFQAAFKEGNMLKTVGVHITPLLEVDNHSFQRSTIVSVGPASSYVADKNDHSAPKFNKAHYHKQMQPFFPAIREDDLYFYQMGIQAKLKNRFDWVIEKDKHYPNCIHLVGIDSPGLTSCLAIAKYVGELLRET